MVKSTNVGEAALDGAVEGDQQHAAGRGDLQRLPQHRRAAPQAFKDLADRARRAKVPIFVVVVGEDRPETRIDIVDARGPDKARPEDPFPVSIDVTGVGLPGRDVTVYLDVFKPGQDPKKDTPVKTLEKKVPFKGTQLPRAQVEFPILPAEFGEIPADAPEKPGKPGDKPAKPEEKPTKPEFQVGEWHFVTRVPRDLAEPINEKFHTRDPVVVRIEKKPLRVLLFASAPLRDYQFIRTMLVREVDKKRMELSIYLQPLPGQARRLGIVQDVPPDRMLVRFPDRLDANKATEEAMYNLANYDVILAFDPDWTELNKDQTDLVERWVSQQGRRSGGGGGPDPHAGAGPRRPSGQRPASRGPATSPSSSRSSTSTRWSSRICRLEKDRNSACRPASPSPTPRRRWSS